MSLYWGMATWCRQPSTVSPPSLLALIWQHPRVLIHSRFAICVTNYTHGSALGFSTHRKKKKNIAAVCWHYSSALAVKQQSLHWKGFAHPGMYCRFFFFTVILLWSPSAKKWGQSSTFQQAVCLEQSLEVSPLWCHRGLYPSKKIKGKEEAEGPAELWFLAAGCKQRGWTLAGWWAWKCRRNTFGGIKVERVVGINDTSLLGWSLGWKINVDDAAPFRRRGGSADISQSWQI